jgi:NAD(P)-dependent dehydrogenase (short-subunit alcohol dehydrogenase family)
MDFGLKDRVAVVTGAAAGIGLDATRALLAEGVKVIAADLRTEPLSDIAGGDQLLPVSVDMRDVNAGSLIVKSGVARFGRIDILLNNAGVALSRDGFLSTSDDDWNATLSLNLMGYVRAARAVIPAMLKGARGGTLIHIASEAGRMPNPLLPDYSVSKAGVIMLSKTLAREFTPQGIRSNVVSPANVRTPLWDKPGGYLDKLAERYGVDREAAVASFLKDTKLPAGRLATARDVTNAVLFLASDLSSYVSGAEIVVDGGVTPTT